VNFADVSATPQNNLYTPNLNMGHSYLLHPAGPSMIFLQEETWVMFEHFQGANADSEINSLQR
jgi:hypothetical protein